MVLWLVLLAANLPIPRLSYLIATPISPEDVFARKSKQKVTLAQIAQYVDAFTAPLLDEKQQCLH